MKLFRGFAVVGLLGAVSSTAVIADNSMIFDCDPIGPTSYIGVEENFAGVDEVYPRFKLKLDEGSITFNKKFVFSYGGKLRTTEWDTGVFRVVSEDGSLNASFDSNAGTFHASETFPFVVLSLGAKCELSEPF